MKSSPCAAKFESSSRPQSGQRAKALGLSIGHVANVRTSQNVSRPSAVESEPPDSSHRIATALLRNSRNELNLTQDKLAELLDSHATVVGRRERGEFDLGPLRDWCALLREIVRAKGPSAASAFLTAFVDALSEKDSKR